MSATAKPSSTVKMSAPTPGGHPLDTGHYLHTIDAYIGKSAEFAQPILWHVREIIHKAVPELEEAIKWSRPFFMYHGIILGNMAAFKTHCSVGVWGEALTAKIKADGTGSGEAMGSFGRLATVQDLPSDKVLLGYYRLAAKQIDDGSRTVSYERPQKAAKVELEIPAELLTALSKNKAAQKAFDNFAPSCRKEYIEWVADAKREATRTARVTQAVAWMAEGKRRHWKYEDC